MEFLRKFLDVLTGNPSFTPADPGYDPMEEPARKGKKSVFGCFFWIVVLGVMASVFFAVSRYQKQQKLDAQNTIATSVQATENSITLTPTPSLIPTMTGTKEPTGTRTPTITTTPATATMTATPTLTPQPNIVYQDRTIVITIQVPWVITQIVRETVIIVVTATPTFTPSPSFTPPTPGGPTPTVYY